MIPEERVSGQVGAALGCPGRGVRRPRASAREGAAAAVLRCPVLVASKPDGEGEQELR